MVGPQWEGYRVFNGTAEWTRHPVAIEGWQEPEQEDTSMKHHKYRRDIPSDNDRDDVDQLADVDAIDADQDSVASSGDIVRIVTYLSRRLDTITKHMREIENQIDLLFLMTGRVHTIIGVRKGTPDEPEAWDVMRED